MSTQLVKKVSILDNASWIVSCYFENMPSKQKDFEKRPGKLFIAEWCRFRETTQEKLASDIGISKSVISKINSGKQRYNQDILEGIAHQLECDVMDLFVDPHSTAFLPSMSKKLAEIPDDERQPIIAIIESFRAKIRSE